MGDEAQILFIKKRGTVALLVLLQLIMHYQIGIRYPHLIRLRYLQTI